MFSIICGGSCATATAVSLSAIVPFSMKRRSTAANNIGRRGKKLSAMRLGERCRRTADRHDEIEPGTCERGAQASDDRVIRRANALAGRLKCDLDVVNGLG